MNKRKSMSRYAFLLLGIVIMSEPVLSYGLYDKTAGGK